MLALRLRVVESVTMWMVAAMVIMEGIAVERSDEKKKTNVVARFLRSTGQGPVGGH